MCCLIRKIIQNEAFVNFEDKNKKRGGIAGKNGDVASLREVRTPSPAPL